MYRCYAAVSTSRSTSTSIGRYPPFQPPPRPTSFKPNGAFAKHTKSTVDASEEKLRKKLGSTDWTATYTHDVGTRDATGAGKRTGGLNPGWPYHDTNTADLRENTEAKMKGESENLARRSKARSARRSDEEDKSEPVSEKVSEKYNEYKEKASNAINEARSDVREAAAKASAEEKDLTGTVVETAKEWGSKAADTVKTAAQKVKETVQETSEQAKKEGKPFTTKAAEQAREKVSEMSQAAAAKVDNTFGSGTSEKIQSAAETAAQTAKTAAAYTASKAADVASTAWHKMTDKSTSEVADEMKDKASEMASDAADKAKGMANDAAYKMKDMAADAKDKIKRSASDTMDKVKEKTSEGVEKVKEAASDSEGITGTLKRTASNVKERLEQFETVRKVEQKASEMFSEAPLDPLEKQIDHTLKRTHEGQSSKPFDYANQSSGNKPMGEAKMGRKSSSGETVVERAESAAEAARDIAGRVTDAAAEQVSKASEAVKAKGSQLKGKVERSWDEMQASLPKDRVEDSLKKAHDMEKDLKDVTREDLKKAQEAVGVIIPTNEADAADVVKTTAEEARDTAKTATQMVKDRVMQGVDMIKEAATHPPEGVKKAAETVIHTAQDAAAKVEENISKNVGEENWREFRQVFHSLSENVKSNLRARWSKNSAESNAAPSLLTSEEIGSLRKLAGAASTGIAHKTAEAWTALKEAALRPKVELDGPPVGFSMALKDQDDLMDRLAQLKFSESNLRDLSTDQMYSEPRRADTETAAAPPTAIPADSTGPVADLKGKTADQVLNPAQKQSNQ